jgi:peptidoglycan hydrolase CwlO-like protein
MTKNFILTLALLAILVAMLSSVGAQDARAQLLKAVSELTQQQAQIADNQTKIDGKIADLGETIRVARIFMSRAGGKHKPPPPPK